MVVGVPSPLTAGLVECMDTSTRFSAVGAVSVRLALDNTRLVN